MNKYSLNAVALNGIGGHNTLVNLGAASSGVGLFIYEHISPELAGATGIEVSVYGDITKMSQLGAVSTGLAFATSAALTRYTMMPLGPVHSAVALAANATLDRLTITFLGAVQAPLVLQTHGELTRRRHLVGVADMALSVDAALTRRINVSASDAMVFNVTGAIQKTHLLGEGTTALEMRATGDLTQHVIRHIPAGLAELALDASATLTKYVIRPLPEGEAAMGLNATASLTNNVGMSTQFTLNLAGDLSVCVRQPLGTASTGVALVTTGDLSVCVVSLIPMAYAGMQLSANGSLKQGVMMSGATGIGFNTLADLSVCVVSLIPAAHAGVHLSADGDLQQEKMLSGSTEIDFNVQATLFSKIKMEGSTGITLSAGATLFNNPDVADLPAFLLTRPYVDRVLVRQ